MAKSGNTSDTKVTRIKASDSARQKKTAATVQAKNANKKVKPSDANGAERSSLKGGVLGRLVGYFKGSWYELRQVRWPDRRATWGMTGALLAFTAFFVVIILLLDAVFAKLFNILLGN